MSEQQQPLRPTPPYPYSYPYAPQPPVPYPAPPPSTGLSIASMVLGILGFLSCLIPFVGGPLAVLATIFGAVGLKKAGEQNGAGRGMAIAGLVLGIIAIIVSGLIFFAFMSAIGSADDPMMY